MPTPTAANPVQDPRYRGVTYTGDWGGTHPWHPVDSSQVRSPLDYVRQVEQMGEWASAQDKARAAEIRKAPHEFVVSSTGIVQPKPSWLARNGPKLALFAVAGVATAGIASAAMGAGAGAGAAGAGSVGAGTGAGAGMGAYAAPAALASQGVSAGIPAAGAAAGGAGTVAGATSAAGGGGGYFRTVGQWLNTNAGAEGVRVGGQLVGGYLQNRALNKAGELQANATRESLEFLKAQDARDFAEYLKERDRQWGHENEDRVRAEEMRQLQLLREREREARLAPFRDGAAQGYKSLASLLTLPEGGGVRYAAPISPAARPVLADLVRG